jgi:hypothetical protein
MTYTGDCTVGRLSKWHYRVELMQRRLPVPPKLCALQRLRCDSAYNCLRGLDAPKRTVGFI